MNYFLLFIILVLCGGGYYEYTVQAQSETHYQQQISDLSAEVEKARSDGTKIAAEKDEVSKKLADAQTKIADLNSQIAAAVTTAKAEKDAEAEAKAVAAAQAAAAKQAAAAALPSNNLGTITTLDGKAFQNCQLLRVETDGITFSHSTGITKIIFPILQPGLQKRFGFDPRIGTELTDAQVLTQEAQRKAAAKTTGH